MSLCFSSQVLLSDHFTHNGATTASQPGEAELLFCRSFWCLQDAQTVPQNSGGAHSCISPCFITCYLYNACPVRLWVNYGIHHEIILSQTPLLLAPPLHGPHSMWPCISPAGFLAPSFSGVEEGREGKEQASSLGAPSERRWKDRGDRCSLSK